jgi:hypothetical protein
MWRNGGSRKGGVAESGNEKGYLILFVKNKWIRVAVLDP